MTASRTCAAARGGCAEAHAGHAFDVTTLPGKLSLLILGGTLLTSVCIHLFQLYLGATLFFIRFLPRLINVATFLELRLNLPRPPHFNLTVNFNFNFNFNFNSTSTPTSTSTSAVLNFNFHANFSYTFSASVHFILYFTCVGIVGFGRASTSTRPSRGV